MAEAGDILNYLGDWVALRYIKALPLLGYCHSMLEKEKNSSWIGTAIIV
jgi:hypothetical protein